MRWFSDLKIRGKLFVICGVLLTCTAGLALFAVQRLSHLSAVTTELAEDLLPGTDAAASLRAQVLELRLAQYRTITEATAAGREKALAEVQAELAHIEAAAKAYEPLITDSLEREHFATFRRKLDAYMVDWRETHTLVMNGAHAEAVERMVQRSAQLHVAMDSSLAAMIELNRTQGDAAAKASNRVYASARIEVLLGLVVCLVLGFAISASVARRMAGSLAQVARVATSLQENCLSGTRRALDALSNGDMSVRTKPVTMPTNNTDADEVGELARTCDRMIVDVKAVLAAVTVTQERVEAMVSDAMRMVDAARHGQLDTRADHEQYGGSFRELVGGLNATLAAVATPMTEVNDVLQHVAARDLTHRVTGKYEGTFATVAAGVNTAIDSLDTTLAQVNTAASEVAHATREITSSAQTLANGASEQAASLEEISASLHVFAAMTQQSATSAVEASSLAAGARAEANEGAARMERLTQAVTEIREASSETAKIIRTIDEIAFQTNLLALNAAVEAARAGDAGRGFAVVADEVRSLALRAASAAQTTTALIERGQNAAERGVSLNAEVLQSLNRINDHIVRVSEVTSSISDSGRQQEEGVAQIKIAVDQINTITQQVAASAEESAGAATELSSQSDSLRDTVRRFTLTSATRPRQASTPPRARRVTYAPASTVRPTRTPSVPLRDETAANPGTVILF